MAAMLTDLCTKLAPTTQITCMFEKASTKGLQALRFNVISKPAKPLNVESKPHETRHVHGQSETHSESHSHVHSKSHSHSRTSERKEESALPQEPEMPHFSVQEITEKLVEIARELEFPPAAEEFLSGTFQCLIDAEMSIHQTSRDRVHLHEIGSLDTILDLVGITYGFWKLGVFDEHSPTKVYFTPIAVGGGKVRIAHGLVPVPAPATLEILTTFNLSYVSGPEPKELTTPTGAAVLAGFVKYQRGEQCQKLPAIRPEQYAMSTGNLVLQHQPNLLRMVVGEPVQIRKSRPPLGHFQGLDEPVAVIETNIDDLTGEYSGHLISELIKHGALDVAYLPTTTKKNRPGHLVQVICSPSQIEALVEKIFMLSKTLGVRYYLTERICLPRRKELFQFSYGNETYPVHLKLALTQDGHLNNCKVEFDELVAIQKQTGLPLSVLEQLILTEFFKNKNMPPLK